MDSSDRSFYDFDFKSLRKLQDSLSVFCLLVNANAKLRNVIHTTQSAVLKQYAFAVRDAVTAIFHVPKVQDQSPSLVPPLPAIPPAYHPNIATPGPSSESGRESDVYQGRDSMDLDRRDCSVVEEGPSNFANDLEECSTEEDDEPDTINGLTFPEMRTVLHRVSDGTIPDLERAESAMLMLGMAGGKLLLLNPLHSSF